MRPQMVCACALALLGFAVSPVRAQTADTVMNHSGEPVPGHAVAVADTEPAVIQYDLSGPRIGLTLSSEGAARSQFGWHSENQAAPGTRGPWFLVERIFLIGGVERSEFIPTGTLVFGVRTPSSFEFGIGPSISLGPAAVTTAVVVACGQTLHYGGIRVPVNMAVAMSQRNGINAVRVTLITGWAIKQPQREVRHEQ